MRFVAVVAVLIVAGVVAQPTVPSVSATVTPTATVTPSPQSVSVTPTPSNSAMSVSVTPSVTSTPVSLSVTPTITISPFASLTGRWCQRDACIAGSCITGSRCCSGFCINDAYVPATIAIGGTCTSSTYSTSCTLCGAGLSCDSTTNKCVVYGMGYGCSGTCSTAADCASGLSCTTNSKCGFTNIGVGGVCNSAATCYTGLTCTNGVCTAIARAGACNSANQPYDPSLSTTAVRDYFALDGACVNTDYCASSVCAAKKSTGTACTTAAECVSGICNSLFCAAANSIASQQACSSSNACASGLFCGGGACQPLVGQGARCTQSYVLPYTPATQGWCSSGLVCSNYDNSRPQCMPGAVAVGGVCYNSDQCTSASHWGCTPDTPQSGTIWARGVAGKCSGSSYGLPCIPGNNTWCANSEGGQSNSCGTCSNADGSAAGTWVCNPAATVSPCASLLTASVNAIYSAGYAQSNGGGLYAAMALSGTSAAVAYACCNACNGGSSITISQGAVNLYGAIFGRSFDCSASTAGSAFSGTTQTNICVGTATVGQTVALPGATLLGACKPVSAAASIVPSLALLVAIVAATLALIL